MRAVRRAVRRLLRRVRRRVFPGEQRHSLVGQAHLWKMKRDFQIGFLKGVGLKPEHYLLDIGCGTLRGGVPIIRHLDNGHYFGIDTRAAALEEGRKELRAAGLVGKDPALFCTNEMSSLDLGRKFDCVWAFSVLFHMTDEILDDCFALVSRHLDERGAFYANVNIGTRPAGAWKEFPVVWRTLESYERMGATHGLEVEDIGPLRALGHVTGIENQDNQRMLKFTLAGRAAPGGSSSVPGIRV